MYRSYSPNGNRSQQSKVGVKQLLIFGLALLLVSTLAVWYFAVLPVRQELGECENRTDEYRTKWEAAERENSRIQEAKFLLDLEVKELEEQLLRLEERERDQFSEWERKYADAMVEMRQAAADQAEDFSDATLMMERTLQAFADCDKDLEEAIQSKKSHMGLAAVCEEDLYLCDSEAAACLKALDAAVSEDSLLAEQLELVEGELDAIRVENHELKSAKEVLLEDKWALADQLADCRENADAFALAGDDDDRLKAYYHADGQQASVSVEESFGGVLGYDLSQQNAAYIEEMKREAEYLDELLKEEEFRYAEELLIQEEDLAELENEELAIEEDWEKLLADRVAKADEDHDEELYRYFQAMYASSEVYSDAAWEQWMDGKAEPEDDRYADLVVEYVLGIEEEKLTVGDAVVDYDSEELDDDFDIVGDVPAFVWAEDEDDDEADEALEPEFDLKAELVDDEDEVLAELEYAWDREDEEENLDRYDDDDRVLRYDDDDENFLFTDDLDLLDLEDDEEEVRRMAFDDEDFNDVDDDNVEVKEYWN